MADTETIDKLFLELSQVTSAKTEREIRLQKEVDEAYVIIQIIRTRYGRRLEGTGLELRGRNFLDRNRPLEISDVFRGED